MKRFFMMALVAAAFVSCSDDDNADVALTGTWKLTSIVVPYGWDLNNDGNATNDLVAESGCMDNSLIIFPDDIATASIRMQSLEIEEVDQDNGDVTYEVECTGPDTEEAVYTVSGNDVSFLFNGEQVTFVKAGNKLTASQDGTTIVFTKI